MVARIIAEDLRIGPEILKHRATPIAGCATRCASCWAHWLASRRGEAVPVDRNAGAGALGPAPPGRAGRAWSAARSPITTSTAMFTALHNFCAVDLSAFYFDIRKDRLYCDGADDPAAPRDADGAGPNLRLPGRAGWRRSCASPPRRHGWRATARRRGRPPQRPPRTVRRGPGRLARRRWRRGGANCATCGGW